MASLPALPPPFSVSSLDASLATDKFDQAVATQLLRDAALIEKLIAGEQLAKAVNDFSRLSVLGASPELDSDKWGGDVQESLRVVDKAMDRYNARISALTYVEDAQKALMKSTEAYLAKKGK